jgi:chitinase
VNLLDATKSIMANYRTQNNKKMMLTMAPETAFVQGGQSAYSGIWGAYLPVIQGLKDSLDILHVQLYNSGTMYGIDNNIYAQGTADFIVAMSEAVIQGFSTAGGTFSGLPASKVSVGLPACTSAAGGGYTQPGTVDSAIKYLMGNGPKPGSYTLTNANGYPALNGMMTWSVNWDAVSTCGVANEYAILYESIFGAVTPNQTTVFDKNNSNISLYPNPCSNQLYLEYKNSSVLDIKIYNLFGQLVYQNTINGGEQIDASNFAPSIYVVEVNGEYTQFVKSND